MEIYSEAALTSISLIYSAALLSIPEMDFPPPRNPEIREEIPPELLLPPELPRPSSEENGDPVYVERGGIVDDGQVVHAVACGEFCYQLVEIHCDSPFLFL